MLQRVLLPTKFIGGLCLCVLLVAACTTAEPDIDTGPRLVSERTLGPTQALPTQVVTNTPQRITPEQPAPLDVVTVEADFVLVTPTLPPSKTPTSTPTFTLTPSPTRTPTQTATATATLFLLPTSQFIPITRDVAAPINQVCDSTWFFIEPRPASCPLNPPNVTQAVYQSFQNGHMVWVQSQDAIYVLYGDSASPRWQVFRDYFIEGMVEETADFDNAPAPGLWQPRRGFGLLWRDNIAVRQRIGWGTMEWEIPYSVRVQTAQDGSLFLDTPNGLIFTLLPNGINWQQTLNTGVPGTNPGGGIGGISKVGG